VAERPGHHARHLAVGTFAYQVAQAVAVLAGLVVATLLARRLSLAAFGMYGLVLSFALYLAFMQGAAITVMVRRLPAAGDREAHDHVITASWVVFAGVGAMAGILVAIAGNVLLSIFAIPPGLEHQARLGVLALALAVCLGWPMRLFSELLRASHRFAAAAGSETAAYVAWGLLMVGLVVLLDAPLWILIGTTGSMSLLMGLAGLTLILAGRADVWPRTRRVSWPYVRDYVREVVHVATQTASGIVVAFSDRAVLAFFTTPATVGLLEAAIRPSNVMRQLHNSLIRTVVPASSRFLAEGDDARTRELLLRGTRYVLATSLPLTLTLVILSEPILDLWLGPRFRPAATAMSILVGAQLFEASKAVAVAMLLGAGRARALAIYSWGFATLQFCLSVGLTRLIGLEGTVLAFTGAALVLYPIILRMTLRTFPVTLRELAVRAWLPAYALAAPLAAALLAIRFALPLHGAATVLVGVGGVAAYWAAFYRLWFRREERALLEGLLGGRRPSPTSGAGRA
jgi:O-antigen/teichoic acid export membrane protein